MRLQITGQIQNNQVLFKKIFKFWRPWKLGHFKALFSTRWLNYKIVDLELLDGLCHFFLKYVIAQVCIFLKKYSKRYCWRKPFMQHLTRVDRELKLKRLR